jgi:plastocyanin
MKLHQLKRPRLLLAALVALTAVALTGTAFAAQQAVKPQKVTVGMSEYKFAIPKKTFKVGKVSFAIKNVGDEVHDFKVQGKSPKSRFLAANGKQTITINFTKPGKYQYLCTIGEHAIKGMQGVLTIKR